MKKLALLFITIAASLFINSCSTKFNVAAPYKNITVVYGLLDMADTAHYIRIEKAFLDQNKSALTMAQTPDSSFYSNLNVRVERYNFSGSGKYVDTIHLYRVDLAQEGYPKDSGTFFNAPDYAYKFTNLLDANYIYRIKATNLATGETDSADAPIINDLDNTIFSVDLLDAANSFLDFFSTSSTRYQEISASYVTTVTNFNFEGAASPVGIAQVVIRFNWTDSNGTTLAKTNQYYDFNAGYVPTASAIDYQINDIALYNALITGMGQAPANTFRLLGRCTLSVYLSTSDWYNYQQASLTQGTGLTGSEIEPVVTNIKGANALGLYTSRAMRSGQVTIDPKTVDSLMAYPALQQSKIVGTTYP